MVAGPGWREINGKMQTTFGIARGALRCRVFWMAQGTVQSYIH